MSRIVLPSAAQRRGSSPTRAGARRGRSRSSARRGRSAPGRRRARARGRAGAAGRPRAAARGRRASPPGRRARSPRRPVAARGSSRRRGARISRDGERLVHRRGLEHDADPLAPLAAGAAPGRRRAPRPRRRRACGSPRGSRPWSSCPRRSGRAGRRPRRARSRSRSRAPPRARRRSCAGRGRRSRSRELERDASPPGGNGGLLASAERGRDPGAVGLVADDDHGLAAFLARPRGRLGGRARGRAARPARARARPAARAPGPSLGRAGAGSSGRRRARGPRRRAAARAPGRLSRPCRGQRPQLVRLPGRSLGVADDHEPAPAGSIVFGSCADFPLRRRGRLHRHAADREPARGVHGRARARRRGDAAARAAS